MTAQNKKAIIMGLFSGTVYALIMAGFDYFDEKGFRIWRFLFHFFFFGILMGIFSRYNNYKQKEKGEDN